MSSIKKVLQLLEEAVGQDTYFNTMSEAIETALEYAKKKGYEVEEDFGFKLQPCKYGQTTRTTLTLYKNGKEQRKALQIILYRMESGKYELTCYIN